MIPMASPLIQWYPGHIAKAEKALIEQLKKVDVVLEIRDARIPLATHHPHLQQWIGPRGQVLVLNRVDMIAVGARQQWQTWLQTHERTPYFTNGQTGHGVKALAKAAQAAGAEVNQRRQARGMLPRPIRAVMIGFPNVGKSALINRLLGRRVVESARRAGVTRSLRWVRLSEELELLDAPGILPNKLEDQQAATKLAICDDIGTASYDEQRVAAALVDLLKQLQQEQFLFDRYGVDAASMSGESYLHHLAATRYQGDRQRTAQTLLNDFRIGKLGPIALELPPVGLTLQP
jgi:ribosome biogenesis GTPase A